MIDVEADFARPSKEQVSGFNNVGKLGGTLGYSRNMMISSNALKEFYTHNGLLNDNADNFGLESLLGMTLY